MTKLVSNYRRILKKVWDRQAGKQEVVIKRLPLNFRFGPTLASCLKTQKTFLWIPHGYDLVKDEPSMNQAKLAFSFWTGRGARWDGRNARFEYDLTEKDAIDLWLERATRRFDELWTGLF